MTIRYNSTGKWVLTFLLGIGAQAHADTLNPFDTDQSKRLADMQDAIKNKASPKAEAAKRSAQVVDALSDYGEFGVNQRRVAIQLASEKVTKDIIDYVAGESEGGEIGYDVSVITKDKLVKDYGIQLTYDADGKVWKATYAGDTGADKRKNFEKFENAVAAKLDPGLWKSLDATAKAAFTNTTLHRLGTDIKDVIKDDSAVTEDMRKQLKGRSLAMGNKDSGTIGALEEKMSVAKKDDVAEKGMLNAEKETLDAMAKADAPEKSVDEFCNEYAANLAKSKSALMIQRRLAATDSSDPCYAPLKTVAATIPDAGRSIAPNKNDPETSKVTSFEDKAREDSRSTASRDGSLFSGSRRTRSDDDYKGMTEAEKKLARERDDALDDRDDLAVKIQDVQGQVDQANRNNALLACNKAYGGGKDPLGLTSDTELNKKIISNLSDTLAKTLSKGYQGLVCEKAGAKDGPVTYAAMQMAAKDVLKGMGIPPSGALTESKVNSLEGISKGALEVANNFTNQERTRGRLNYQLQAAAAKKALSRIATENSGLIDLNSMSYLRTLSYTELTGYVTNSDGSVTSVGNGALPLFLPAQSRDAALQVFDNYYQTALLDLKQENGIGEDFDSQAQCAMALAQEATDRWAVEEDRQGLLGLNRGRSARSLAVYQPTTVRNVDSSKKATPR